MSLKLDGFLKPYRGKEDDLEAFWSKFLVLANANEWDNDDKKAKYLPLLLDKAAYTVYDALDDGKKKKPDDVKSALEEAFAPSAAEAYRSFTGRGMRSAETVDAYVADLKRLLSLSGHKISGDDKDPLLAEQVIRGLPRDFAREIRIQNSSNALTISDIVKRVRAMSVDDDVMKSAGRQALVAAVCHSCNEPGHIRKNCPKRKTATSGERESSGARGAGRSKPGSCWKCGEAGHLRRDCPQRKLGKSDSANAAVTERRQEKAVSDAGSPDGDKVQHKSYVSNKSSELVSVSVTVECDGNDETVLSAIIDTGCTRSLITEYAVTKIGAESLLGPTTDTVYGIDGQPLRSVGTVTLPIHQHDGVLSLPRVSVQFLVVAKHEGVGEDVIIGSDVISAIGGMELSYEYGHVKSVVLRPKPAHVAAAVDSGPVRGLSRHIAVEKHADGDVILTSSDFQVRWSEEKKFWTLQWEWLDDAEPTAQIGPNIGEYPRSKLTADQESHFRKEVAMWVEKGFLVPYRRDEHGTPGAVLPLMAVAQEHKPTTPVRPCLDYRRLNQRIVSHPGVTAPACDQKIREWRRQGSQNVVIDISRAYLRVHIHSSLERFQVVKFDSSTYVMSRMGFGLNIAPKVMDAIVKFALTDVPGADNYVDDIFTDSGQVEAAKSALARYGLPTKPAEMLPEARVLGLQMSTTDEGEIHWARRDGVDLSCPEKPTKRQLFSWCGKLVGHYPVAAWLRPMCSFIKRQAVKATPDKWDIPVPEEVESLCRDVEARIEQCDPVHGTWLIESDPAAKWSVWCDASNVAIGVVLTQRDTVVEDQCWLRKESDSQHINVAELEAVVKGLNLAITHHAKAIAIKTDSKSVHGWLVSLLDNVQRVKVGGLYAASVKRRLEIIDNIVSSYQLKVSVEWVPSQANRADQLTRVPQTWLKVAKADGACAAAAIVPGILQQAEIREAQCDNAALMETVRQVENGADVTDKSLKRVVSQLHVRDGILMRSVKVPPNEVVDVPVLAEKLQQQAIAVAHAKTGHGSWESTHRLLSARCYFPGQASKVQQYVQDCGQCRAANAQGAEVAQPSRPVSPGGPWRVVQMDTLELGPSRNGYHCVLVCVDLFTKWAEVVPLKAHDAKSVASAFVDICARWGAPEVVRSDNGTEFVNEVVEALYTTFGVHVRHGAVRHPASQGGVERFNRTLLTMLRKVHAESVDWKADLFLLLHFYRNRPHGALKISPSKAMLGWEPRDVIVAGHEKSHTLTGWVADLERRAADIRDYVEEQLATGDFIESHEECPYLPGDTVQLRNSERRQKLLPAFDRGWCIKKVITPSTVVIYRGRSEKVVNIDLIKPDGAPDQPAHGDVATAPERPDSDEDDGVALHFVPVVPADDQGHSYRLRDRTQLRAPPRY